MPRKNKGKSWNRPLNQLGRNSSPDFSEVITNNFAVNEGENQFETLRHLKDMFNGKIDSEVVSAVFSSFNFNSNQAIEALIDIANGSSLPNGRISLSAQQQKSQCYTTNSSENLESTYNTSRSSPINPPEKLQLANALHKDSAERLPSKDIPNFPLEDQNPRKDLTQCSYQPFVAENHHSLTKLNFPEQNLFLQNRPNNLSQIFHKTDTQSKDCVSHFAPISSQQHTLHHLKEPLFKFDDQTDSQKGTKYSNIPPKFITPHVASNISQFSHAKYSDFKKVTLTCRPPGEKPLSVPFSNQCESSNYQPKMMYNILAQIKHRVKVLVLLRGLPGSGKSTLASTLRHSGLVLSTDDYFFVNQRYCFDPAQLSEAHHWNKERTASALERGETPVIIDNTNIESWEMQPYVALGLKFQYNIHIVEPSTPWKFNPNELFRLNTHGVPKAKIIKMLQRYDHNVTLQTIVNSLENSPYDVHSSRWSHRHTSSDFNFQSNHTFTKSSERKYQTHTAKSNVGSHNREPNPRFNGNRHFNTSSVILKPQVCRINGSEGTKWKNEESNVTKQRPPSDKLKNCNYDFRSSLEEDESASSEHKKYHCSLPEINNLKDLMILSQEDSEENMSSSYRDSPACSSKNGSDWESVTDQEDFVWATDFPVLITNVPEIKEMNSNGLSSTKLLEGEVKSVSNLGGEFLPPKPQRIESKFTISSTPNDTPDVNKENNILPKNCDQSKTSFICNKLESLAICDELVDIDQEYSDGNHEIHPNKPESMMDPKSPSKLNVSNENVTISHSNESELTPHALETISEEMEQEGIEYPRKKKSASKARSRNKRNYYYVENFLGDLPNELSVTDWEFPPFQTSELSENSNGNPAFASGLRQENYRQGSDVGKMVPCSRTSDSVKNINSCYLKAVDSSSDQEYDSEIQISKEKLTILQDCFQNFPVEDLECHLKSYDGDSDLLSNIILDSENDMACDLTNDCGAVPVELNAPDSFKFSINQSMQCHSNDPVHPEKSKELESGSTPLSNFSHPGNENVSSNSSVNSIPAFKFTLTLDSAFAEELENCFGPVMVDDIGALKNRTVTIRKDLAKQIYDEWVQAVSRNSVLTFPEANEGHADILEYSMQNSEVSSKNEDVKAENFVQSNSGSCSKSKLDTSVSFAEMMDHEYALALQQQEKVKLAKLRTGGDLNIRLKRQLLYEKFPEVDRNAVNEVLENSEYSLENSIYAVKALYYQPSDLEKELGDIDVVVDEEKKQLFGEFASGDFSSWIHIPRNDSAADSLDGHIAYLREKAQEKYVHWQQYAERTKQYRQRGDLPTASFFSRQAADIQALYESYNKEACIAIYKRNKQNNSLVLDLHGYFVKEAIPVLERFLQAKKTEYSKGPQTEPLTLSVITGQGVHSISGSKLKPAVISFLNRKQYRYVEANSGMLSVFLYP